MPPAITLGAERSCTSLAPAPWDDALPWSHAPLGPHLAERELPEVPELVNHGALHLALGRVSGLTELTGERLGEEHQGLVPQSRGGSVTPAALSESAPAGVEVAADAPATPPAGPGGLEPAICGARADIPGRRP